MIYAISDLHLSFDTNKPMNIFGDNWDDYENKIKSNWIKKVKPEDTVLIAGDFSWAMNLDEAVKDFRFLDELPGTKILIKGNHDYWWNTIGKTEKFFLSNGVKSIKLIQNNSIAIGDYSICGAKYWATTMDEDNEKMFNRETQRLKLSLKSATKNNIIVMTHYPPDERILEVIKGYNVIKWIYGHVHANYENSLVNFDGVNTLLTSCDYLNFDLVEICR